MIKAYIRGLLAVLLLFAIVVGLVVYKNYQTNKKYNKIPAYLSADQIATYQKNISDIQAKLKTTDKKDKDGLYNLYMQEAFNYYGLGQMTFALDAFNQAKTLHPEQSSLYAALFNVDVAMDNNSAAEADIKKAVDLYQANPDYWNTYITFEKNVMKRSQDEILGLYASALSKTQGAISILVSNAQYLTEIGKYQQAKETWQLAEKVNPAGKADYEKEITALDAKIKAQ